MWNRMSLMVVVLLALLSAGFGADVSKATLSATGQAELKALDARAKALSEYTKTPAWAQLLADYDAWAKKYGARSEARIAPTGGWRGPFPGGTEPCTCKPVDQCGPHCYCVLVNCSSNRCEYHCEIIQ